MNADELLDFCDESAMHYRADNPDIDLPPVVVARAEGEDIGFILCNLPNGRRDHPGHVAAVVRGLCCTGLFDEVLLTCDIRMSLWHEVGYAVFSLPGSPMVDPRIPKGPPDEVRAAMMVTYLAAGMPPVYRVRAYVVDTSDDTYGFTEPLPIGEVPMMGPMDDFLLGAWDADEDFKAKAIAIGTGGGVTEDVAVEYARMACIKRIGQMQQVPAIAIPAEVRHSDPLAWPQFMQRPADPTTN